MPDRPPLKPAAVQIRAPWTRLTVVDELPSTNAALLGQPAGSVLVAEFQSAGRGRVDRTWISPPRAGLTFSALLQPPVHSSRWGWLPLMAGLALSEVIPGSTMKWPNDVLVDGRKVAGILAAAAGPDVIVGIGLNVSTTRAELPIPEATSLALVGLPTDRAAVLQGVLAEWGRWYLAWTAADGDAEQCGLAAAYRARCATIGQVVNVTGVAGAPPIAGRADAVDASGRLVVDGMPLSAGDVTHVRPASSEEFGAGQ